MNYFMIGVLIWSHFTETLSFGGLDIKDPSYGAIKSHRNIDRSKRVADGEKVERHSKPWMVFLTIQTIDGLKQCGGFLVNPHLYVSSNLLPPKNTSDIVVTAAHCVTYENHSIVTAVDPSVVRAYFGRHNPYVLEDGVENVTAINVIVHEDYTTFMKKHDIAIVRLSEAANFTRHVQPLHITSFNSTSVVDCSVSGWGPDPKIKSGVNGNGVLQTSYLEDLGNVSISPSLVTLHWKDGAKIVHGDSGSPVLCHKDGKAFAQGVTSTIYPNEPFFNYADIFQMSPWFFSAMEKIYSPTMSHIELYKYIRSGAHNRDIFSIKLNDLLRNFHGYTPIGVQVQLEVKTIDYYQAWINNKLQKWVLLDHKAFNAMDIVGYTEEKDVYNCVSACFIRNSLGGCNYVPISERCYFLGSRQPCGDGGKCIRFGDYETVHIYYNEKLIEKRPTVIEQAPKNAPTVELPLDKKTSRHIQYDVYLSYEREGGYVCPAVLRNRYQNDTSYDIATVSGNCFINLIHPYQKWDSNLNDTLHINIVANSTVPKRITLPIGTKTLDKHYHADNSYGMAFIFNSRERIPSGHKIYDPVNDRENDRIDVPVAVPFNEYMGGREVEPFTKPWMVFLHGESGEFCQGVFIDDPQLAQSTPKMYYILTSRSCFVKEWKSEVKARFGVHLFTMESLYEQSVRVLQKHVNEQNNLVLMVVQNSFSLNEQISPIPLRETFETTIGSNFFAYGWNLKCPHRKVLHEIPMSLVNETSKTTILVRPKEQHVTQCNGMNFNAGRPLVHCMSENENCSLIGISTFVMDDGGESFENVTIVWSLVPWLQEKRMPNVS